MASVFLVIPPLVKYTAGPLLGPSMLQGAACAAGHEVRVIDLNNAYIRERLIVPGAAPSGFAGDHDKPREALGVVATAFHCQTASRALELLCRSRASDLAALSHEATMEAANALAGSDLGEWIVRRLGDRLRPDLVGVSVMFGGQVVWALAVTIVAKRLWPDVSVVWGGPHVTALRDVIALDRRHGEHVDGFVVGHAERTFVELLDTLQHGRPWPREVMRAGCGVVVHAKADALAAARFDDLRAYGIPRLTVPVQASRGCPYARCAYCCYPAIEGRYSEVPDVVVARAVLTAQSCGAVLSLKDSLLLPARLRRVSAIVRGRVPWSGCTKLSRALDADLLDIAAASGCQTLEIGLETLDTRTQATIAKRQSEDTLFAFACEAGRAGIALVVNYMTGFPGEDPDRAEAHAARAREVLDASGALYRIEHNRFELQRLSPMARAPSHFGLRVTRQWPWSSNLEWEPCSQSHLRPSGIPMVAA